MRKEELLRLIKNEKLLEKKKMGKVAYVLNKKGKKELTGLIQQFIEKHPDLKSLVNIEKGELVPKIQGLFSHFWNWNEVRQLISELEIILEGIRKNKKLWNRELLNEMDDCTKIMIKNVDNVFGEDELQLFLEDWFETLGEIFVKTKPTIKEKREFVQKIYKLIDKDDYGLDTSYERALVAICNSKQDAELIKGIMKPLESKHPRRKEHYDKFCEELDKK